MVNPIQERADFVIARRPEADEAISNETNPARYIPMMAEWIAVPPWQRWAIWMRAAEVGSIGIDEYFKIVLAHETYHLFSATGVEDLVKKLTYKLGHHRPLSGFYSRLLPTMNGGYSFHFDKMFLDLERLQDLGRWASASRSQASSFLKIVRDEIHNVFGTITHELKHRDAIYPHVPEEDKRKKLAALYGALANSDNQQREQAISAAIHKLEHDINFNLLRGATGFWQNFGADAKTVLTQNTLREYAYQLSTQLTEADAYLTGLIFQISSSNDSIETYSVYVDNKESTFPVPKPLCRPVKAAKQFISPSLTDQLRIATYRLARSRVAISAFRCVELGGNLTALLDAMEIQKTFQDFQRGKKDEVALALQGITTATSLPASIIGTVGLFAVDKLRYLRIAGPLAMISGALAASKRCYETWQNDEATSKEKWWSVAEAASSFISAGASIALGFRTPAVLPLYGPAAMTYLGRLLPTLAMGGLVFSIAAGLMQSKET